MNRGSRFHFLGLIKCFKCLYCIKSMIFYLWCSLFYCLFTRSTTTSQSVAHVFFCSLSSSFHSFFFFFNCALHCPSRSPPRPFPSGWKAILVLDWRMMLLLRESLHQHWGKREKSSGGVVVPWGAIAVMGELSNAPLSKLPSKHHVTTRD